MELDPASKLGEFFEETKDDSPDVRAEKLEAHKAISEVHDEVAKEGQTSVSITSLDVLKAGLWNISFFKG